MNDGDGYDTHVYLFVIIASITETRTHSVAPQSMSSPLIEEDKEVVEKEENKNNCRKGRK